MSAPSEKAGYHFPSVLEMIDHYVERIAALRQNAADTQRSTYAVALGQLHAIGLIDEAKWRDALDRPRIQR